MNQPDRRALFWSDVLVTFVQSGLPAIGVFVMGRMLGQVCDAITFRYYDEPLIPRTVTAPMLEQAASQIYQGPVKYLSEKQRESLCEAARLGDARGVDGAQTIALVETALFDRLSLSPVENRYTWTISGLPQLRC